MTWLLIGFVTAIIVVPFILEARKPVLSDDDRATAPGAFADLSQGRTHFQWLGPADGPVLVCIHGLTTASHVWNDLAPALAQAGFRVLTYDLYGRGFSDKPPGAQDARFFIRQLDDLLFDQGIRAPVSLLGYSMGGAIATCFAEADPPRVARVLMLAPAGMALDLGGLSKLAQKLPVLGDWLMLVFGGKSLVQGVGSPGATPEKIAQLSAKQASEVARRGYLPAVLSSQRNILARPLEAQHRALGQIGMPVAAIWGVDDTVIPISALATLTDWNPNARHEQITGAGHGLPFSHPVDVLDALGRLINP